VGERRRRTMGERGATPDPLNGGLYCRHCASQYCICDGYGNKADAWADDDWTEDDYYWAGDADNSEQGSPDKGSPEKETDSGSEDDWVALGVGAAGVAVVAGVAGAMFGLPAAAGVVGVSIAGFVAGALFGDKDS
jgi:hypothetical protein